jgi:type IV pilus assembly protein PilM
VGSRIIGLDVGTFAVRAVVLDASFRSLQVIEVAEEPILHRAEAGESVEAVEPTSSSVFGPGAGDALRRLMERGVLTGDAVGAVMSDRGVYLTQLSLPFSGAREINAVLRPQLDGKLPAEVDTLHLDFCVGGKLPSGEHLVFTAAVEPERIAEVLGAYRELGLDPKVVDLLPVPTAAAASWMLGATDEAFAVVDVGGERTSVSVVAHGRLEYLRTFTGGGESVTRALAEAFSLDEDRAREGKHAEGFIDAGDEAAEVEGDERVIADRCRDAVKPIVREIRRCLVAHATQTSRQVQRIYLCGGGSRLSGFDAYLASSLDLPVERLPVQRPEFASLPGFADVADRFVTALGVALRAAGASSMIGFDVRTGPFVFKGGSEQLRSRFVEMGLWMAAILVAGTALAFARMSLLSAEKAELDRQLAELTTEVLGQPVTDPARIVSKLSEGSGEASFVPKHSAYEIFAEVTEAVQATSDEGYDAKAKRIEVDMQRKQFSISGVADSAESVDTLQAKLADVICLREIQRGSVEAARTGDGFEFDMRGSASCATASTVQAPARKPAAEAP